MSSYQPITSTICEAQILGLPKLPIGSRSSSGWRAHVLLAKPSIFAEGSRQGHFFGFALFTAGFIGERKKVEGGIKNSSLASGW
jgi:hypothetical protein